MSTKSIIDKLCKESKRFEEYRALHQIGSFKEEVTVLYEGVWVSLCELDNGSIRTLHNNKLTKI